MCTAQWVHHSSTEFLERIVTGGVGGWRRTIHVSKDTHTGLTLPGPGAVGMEWNTPSKQVGSGSELEPGRYSTSLSFSFPFIKGHEKNSVHLMPALL